MAGLWATDVFCCLQTKEALCVDTGSLAPQICKVVARKRNWSSMPESRICLLIWVGAAEGLYAWSKRRIGGWETLVRSK